MKFKGINISIKVTIVIFLAFSNCYAIDTKVEFKDGFGYIFHHIDGWRGVVIKNTAILKKNTNKGDITPSIIMFIDEIKNLNFGKKNARLQSSSEVADSIFTIIDKVTLKNTSKKNKKSIKIDGVRSSVMDFSRHGFGDIDSDVGGRISFTIINEKYFFAIIGIASPPANWSYTDEFNSLLKGIKFFGI